jgi:hypothetical protein
MELLFRTRGFIDRVFDPTDAEAGSLKKGTRLLSLIFFSFFSSDESANITVFCLDRFFFGLPALVDI